jgi:mannosyltransferase
MAMTAARRSAWTLPAGVTSRAHALAPLALGALVALSLYLRTRDLGAGFWIDEGLSVGIADRPLGDIPGALKLDGSPPLYYSLLHVWMGLFGRSEEATHALSVVCALLVVPAAWWAARAVFGTRASWIAGLLAALNPFLLQYAQETRMYALVMLLGMLATGAYARAFVVEGEHRRRWAVVFAPLLAAMFYTHNWSLFFAVGCGVAWLGLLAAGGQPRRELLASGVIGFGGALMLYAPWVPTFLFQVRHTGAPWSSAPGVDDLLRVPLRLLGAVGQIALLLTAGAGILALLDRSQGRIGARGRATITLAAVFVVAVGAAWISSQGSPAWASRYLSVAVAPLLLLAAGGLAHAGRLGAVGAVIVALSWAVHEEQRPRDCGVDRAEPPRGRPDRLHAARADPGAAPLPAGRPALRDAVGAGRRPWGDRLARRRRAAARHHRRVQPQAADRPDAARQPRRARRADHRLDRELAGALDRTRAGALDGVAPVDIQ